jgi:hypothetical protein
VKAEGLIDAGSVSQQLSFDDIEPPDPAPVNLRGTPAERRTVAPVSGQSVAGQSVSGQSVAARSGSDRAGHAGQSGQAAPGQAAPGQAAPGHERPGHSAPTSADVGAVLNSSRLSAIERVADLARHRFGSGAVRKASLIESGRRTDPAPAAAEAQRTAVPNGSGS